MESPRSFGQRTNLTTVVHVGFGPKWFNPRRGWCGRVVVNDDSIWAGESGDVFLLHGWEWKCWGPRKRENRNDCGLVRARAFWRTNPSDRTIGERQLLPFLDEVVRL